MEPPSVLGGPRFFDDPGLSAWKTSERRAAAPKSAFKRARAFAHTAYVQAGGRPVTPQPEHVGDPLAIELVRGANGPHDNKWTVVVDGMRCPLQRRDNASEGPYFCILPPGVPLKPLTAQTRLRPVAIGVRLEEDALAPLSAHVQLKQVLRTDERVGQADDPPIDAAPTNVGDRIPLLPYRVSSASATAVVVPYPFWAPPHGRIGILDLSPVQAHEEKKDATRAYNIVATEMNAWSNQVYLTELAMHNDGKLVTDAVKAAGTITSFLPTSTSSGGKDVAQLPTKPSAASQWTQRRIHSAKLPDSVSYIIGGEASAAQELAELFDNLTQVCMHNEKQWVKSGETPTIRKHIGAMRLDLTLRGDDKLTRLFDAILSADLFPGTQLFLNAGNQLSKLDAMELTREDKKLLASLRSRFRVKTAVSSALSLDALTQSNDDEEISDEEISDDKYDPKSFKGDFVVRRAQKKPSAVLSSKLRESLKDNINAAMDTEVDNQNKSSLSFTYEYLTLEARKRTTVRTCIHVVVYDYDGTQFEINFESNEENGIVAHAVASQLVQQIETFDERAENFIECMFRQFEKGGLGLIEETRVAIARGYNYLTYQKYAHRRKLPPPAFESRQFNSGFWGTLNIAKQATFGWIDAKSQKLTNLTPFGMDPCRMEQRIAELRLMVREIVPTWPPVDAPAVLRPAFTGDSAATKPDDSFKNTNDDEEEAAELNELYNKAWEKLLPNRQSNLSELQLEEAVRRRASEREQLRQKSIALIDKTATLFDDAPLQQRLLQMLQRDLPQIVTYSGTVNVPFTGYQVDDVPYEILPTEEAGWRYGWVAGLAVQGLALYFGAVAYSFMGTQIISALENEKQVKKGAEAYKLCQNFYTGFMEVMTSSSSLFTLVRTASFMKNLDYAIGVASATSWFDGTSVQEALWQMSFDFAAFPFAVNVRNNVLQFCRRRWASSKAHKNAVNRHLRLVRGKPVALAVKAAQGAINDMRSMERTERESTRFGAERTTTVVHNAGTGRRFCFYEYYDARDTESLLASLTPIVTNNRWDSLPNGAAMKPLPPLDVAEALFEAEQLRNIPLTNTAEFVAGPEIGIPMTPHQMAAQTAAHELVQMILLERHELQGAHLMQTSEQTALSLASGASQLILLTYGSSTGATTVRGDDILWTCTRAGHAARIALRHTTLFTEYEMLMEAAKDDQKVWTAQTFWQTQRRIMMDTFAHSFLEQVKGAAVASLRAKKPGPPLQLLSTEAAQAYSRVDTLVQAAGLQQAPRAAALYAAASSMGYTVYATATPGNKVVSKVHAYLSSFEGPAYRFADQREYRLPKGDTQTAALNELAWASRRIDTANSRKMPLGNGPEHVVTLLAKLSVDETHATYYCPVGSRIQQTPGHVPFSVDALGARIVWLELLEKAADFLAMSVTGHESSGRAVGFVIEGVGLKDTSGRTGMARHPLVIAREANVVRVPQSLASTSAPDKSPPPPVPGSLRAALVAIANEELPMKAMLHKAACMRSLVFNVDRLSQALMLEASLANENGLVTVKLNERMSTVALAVAIALKQAELGYGVSEMAVHVDNPDAERDSLHAVVALVRGAMSKGCKVCTLSELLLVVGLR